MGFKCSLGMHDWDGGYQCVNCGALKLSALKDKNADVRKDAAEALGKIGDARAEEALMAALRDINADVCKSAAEALEQIGKPVVEPLIEVLKDKDANVRKSAAEALGQFGGAQAVEPLIAVLGDKEHKVRKSAAWALGQIGDKRAVDQLIVALKVSKDYIFEAHITREYYLTSLDHDVSKVAAESLGKIRNERAVEALRAVLKQKKDKKVREAAAEALGQIGGEWAVDVLISTALKDKDADVRKSAAKALRQIGGARAVEALITALKDKDADMSKSAAEALEQIGIPDDLQVQAWYRVAKREWELAIDLGDIAVEPLIAALRDKDAKVREFAAEALGQIGDTRAVEPLIVATRDTGNVRYAAACALGKIGDDRAFEPLLDALKDGVKSAAESLRQIVGARAVEPLIAALRDKDANVREAAAEALEQIGISDDLQVQAWYRVAKREWELAIDLGDIAAEPLISVLKNEKSWDVLKLATVAMGKIGGERIEEALIATLKDKDANVRRLAAEALEQIGIPADLQLQAWYRVAKREWELAIDLGDIAVEPLIFVLIHEKSREDVRKSAAETLQKIGSDQAMKALDGFHKERNVTGSSITDNFRRAHLLNSGTGCYMLIPPSERLEQARQYYDMCLQWFNVNRSGWQGDLLIELSVLSDDVGCVLICGRWTNDEGSKLIPKKVIMDCDVFVDSAYSSVRRKEYLRRLVKAVESTVIKA